MSNRPPYVSPAFGEKAFNCPRCGVYARQLWSIKADSIRIRGGDNPISSPVSVTLNECFHCKKSCLWLDGELTVPNYRGMPPNDDMSDDIKKIYKEAGDISEQSPRAAAALLRLALQMLCRQLGGKGETINEDIQRFIKDGLLSSQVTKSMNAVRLTGNNAVHPGVIDFDENPQIVNVLFKLINFIADEALTKPREISESLSELDDALTDKTTKQED